MSQPDQQQPNSGRMELLPLHIDEELTAVAISAAILPWGSPRFMALTGTASADDAAIAAITGEWPVGAPAAIGDIKKQELERLHVDQFCTDYLLASGTLPYTDVQAVPEGHDPPDFHVVRADGTPARLECRQFAIESQRHAHGMFERVRRAVVATDRSKLTHLAGATIFMWFRDEGSRPTMPPKGSDQQTIDAIVSALTQYNYKPQATEVPGGELPDPAPDIGIYDTGVGCSFYAVPMIGAAPATRFFAATGFELALSFQLTFRREEVCKALIEAIEEKDTSDSDELLITIGGPDTHGLTFTSEFFLLDFLLQDGAPTIPATKHLSRVLLHVWGTGKIAQVIPSFEVISEGIYAGLTPPHFPGTPPLAEPQAGGNEGAT